MERRDFVKSLPFIAGCFLPKGQEAKAEPIKGVGIIRFPTRVYQDAPFDGPIVTAQEIAAKLSAEIRQGTIICLPSEKDVYGNYAWDFTIVGGDFNQVKIERQSESCGCPCHDKIPKVPESGEGWVCEHCSLGRQHMSLTMHAS